MVRKGDDWWTVVAVSNLTTANLWKGCHRMSQCQAFSWQIGVITMGEQFTSSCIHEFSKLIQYQYRTADYIYYIKVLWFIFHLFNWVYFKPLNIMILANWVIFMYNISFYRILHSSTVSHLPLNQETKKGHKDHNFNLNSIILLQRFNSVWSLKNTDAAILE